MGMMLPAYSLFVVPPALVVWAVISDRWSAGSRWLLLVTTVALACGSFTVLRTDGIRGGGADFKWRWSQTPEERLLLQAAAEPAPIAPLPPPSGATSPVPTGASTVPPSGATPKTSPAPVLTAREPEWPGFRGPNRDGVVRGSQISTDWSGAPPVQMWHRPIGPGWSSFAVSGDLLYTQEQRGDDEIVACYRVSTGAPVWQHRDAVRFWESNGGAGPRATPTLSHGRVYAFGATGLLNVLDAATGAVIWSHNVASDAGREVPMWGFASSPLVIDDEVVVAASGKLGAYDLATGARRWLGPDGASSYSSPHRVTIDGVTQIVLLTSNGATSVATANGATLWQHAWAEGSTIVQPAVTADGDVLINAITGTGGSGIRRLAVTRKPDGWHADERWTSNGLKPYFNDFVVHKGYAYGFDGSILSSIDLADGKRAWKGGRYGDGQLILLADQDLLLVVSEDGELALVSATPEQFKEVARVPALEGKTWNHPVLIGQTLLVRNGEEMAAYRLTLANR